MCCGRNFPMFIPWRSSAGQEQKGLGASGPLLPSLRHLPESEKVALLMITTQLHVTVTSVPSKLQRISSQPPERAAKYLQ